MNYEVIAIPTFRRELKKLAKKYPSIKSDLSILIEKLQENPNLGISLGNHCRKIRMAISSKGKGKSGGARLITYLYYSQKTVFLLTIYDKSNKENISDKELNDLLQHIPDF